jgi:hypothetical protein
MIDKPKKERRFLKTLGKIGEILLQEVLLKVGSNLVKRIGGKKTLPSILFLFLSISLFAQYPNSPNKQRLGFQTTGDGLIYRGRALDTVGIKSSGLNNAYFILDTVNNILYNYIKTKGGWKFSNGDTIIINGVTMPFDSITFNTAKDGTVGVGEVEYNDTQGSLIQGLKGGLVTNVIGQQLHQRVNNRTGSTLAKGTAVYLSGSQGNRITVAKALGITDAFSANTFGIVAESIANNQSGYVITEGLITKLNTSALVEDSAVYLSPTVAGALTSTKPQAPQHTVYIGVCVKSNAGSGELFVKILNGQELEELHDVRITSPVNNASLYYKLNEKLWRDTTPTLLVSDTASMLTNYLRTGVAASTYLPLTGGTLSANRNNTLTVNSIAVNTSDNTALTVNATSPFYDNTNIGILGTGGTVYSSGIGLKGEGTQKDMNGFGTAIGVRGDVNATFANSGGTNGTTYAGYFSNNATVDGNNYGLFVNTSNKGDYGIYQTGTGINYFGSNSIFAGTLGVTGATTLTGLLKNTSQRLTGNITISDFDVTYNSVQTGPSSSETVNLALQQNLGGAQNISMGGNQGGGGSTTNPNIYFTDNRKAYASIGGIHTSLGTNNQSGHIIFTTTPSLNTVALTERMRISQDGSITMGGTLGVTGASTLTGALTVNNATVLNEGSGDFDTRIESDGNANMVFVDASTNRVGIGTASLSNTLDVNGTLGVTGIANFSNQITISGSVSGTNRLLGKNTSNNGIGDVTIGTGLNLSASDVLTATGVTSVGITAPALFTVSNSPITTTGNLALTYSGTALPIANGGTNATSASAARTNLNVDYVFLPITAGTLVDVNTNKVYIVNTGGSSTTQLDLTTATAGRIFMIKNLASGTIVSTASNVIPLNGGSGSTPILGAGNVIPQWCTLVCDGTNWHIIQRN